MIKFYTHTWISFENFVKKLKMNDVNVVFVDTDTLELSYFFFIHSIYVILNCSSLSIDKLSKKSFVLISSVTKSVISVSPSGSNALTAG
jgi:hypothetical protein